MHAPVPAVEVPHDRNAPGIRRPDREMRSRHALMGRHMRPQGVPQAAVRAFADQVQVDVAQDRAESIGILELPFASAACLCLQHIVPGRDRAAEQVAAQPGQGRLGPVRHGPESRQVRVEHRQPPAVAAIMGAQDLEGSVAAPRLQCGPVAVRQLQGGAPRAVSITLAQVQFQTISGATFYRPLRFRIGRGSVNPNPAQRGSACRSGGATR